jgi:hypothetical protein
MNVPAEIAHKVVESLRSTPIVLALMLINVLVLVGFWYTLSAIAESIERRDAMIKSCIERTP